jgi:arylsulfatase A-like enzyme
MNSLSVVQKGQAVLSVRGRIRRHLARAIGLTIVATVLMCAAAGTIVPGHIPDRANAVVPSRPNILLIVTDDQKYGTVTPSIMPNVYRELSQRGVTFDNGFVSNSWCCPSRASILSGQYSGHNGVWTSGGALGLTAWRRHETTTLATWLHGAGYRTAIIGKYLNGYGARASMTYWPPGWDVTDIIMNIDYHGHDGYYDYDTFQNGKIVHYGSQPEDYSTRVFTQRARQFFAADPKDRYPKFAYLAYPSPHGPYTIDPLDTNSLTGFHTTMPPNVCEADVSDKPLWIRQQPACSETDNQYSTHLLGQLRMLQSVDRGLGQLFSDLTATGQIRNTIIIYISDNGWLLKAHRMTGKELPYEESIRVPLLLRWDAIGHAGQHIPGFAMNIDLAPTITDATGITGHDAYDGVSLLPLITGAATSWRSDFLVEHMQLSDTDKGGPSFCAIRNQRYLWAEYSTGEKELYDLSNDPWQLNNIASTATSQLRTTLHQRLTSLCNPPPPDMTISK